MVIKVKCVLSDIADVTMGQSPKSIFYNSDGQGMPFLQGNRTFGKRYPVFDTYTTMTTKIAKAGDVIMSVRAPVGDLNFTPVDMCLGRGVCGIRMKNGNQDFLYYLLKYYMPQLLNKESGTVFGSVNRNDINALEVEIPNDVKKQQIIARMLAMFDDKIEKNDEINENLQEQAAAIFKAWFVDYIPFNGDAPKEWKNVILEDITILISRGITPKYSDDSNQIVLNQKCIRHHMIDLSLARTHMPKKINEKWLHFGDLLINSTGTGTLGRTAQVWFQPQNLTVDSHITIVRPANENLIFYIGLWGIEHEKEIESLHTGSTGQTELPRDRVKAMKLACPDNETLDRFNAIIAPMAATIVLNQEENHKLSSLRDALLPKLMSGEIDVMDIPF